MTTREQIIAAAKEADPNLDVNMFDDHNEEDWAKIERFYAIAFEAGSQAEREECAKVCNSREDMHRQNYGGYIGQHSKIAEAKCCADDIRARSKE